jgi:hypothetical protein
MTTKHAWMQQTFSPGFWVALTLRRDAAPDRVYVGHVQAADDYGLRLRLLKDTDDDDGEPRPLCEVYVSRAQIKSALVATPDHGFDAFVGEVDLWEQRILAKPAILHGYNE